MLRGFKIFLLVLLVLVSLAGTLIVYLYQNVDQLKLYALREVNAMLKAEMTAESIDVTLFKTFPKVSLSLNQVAIKDPMHPNQYVLQAGHLFLGFDIYDILNKRYKIQLLDLDSGSLNLFIDPLGRKNFDLLKESEKTPNSEQALVFELNKLELNRMQVNFKNLSTSFEIASYIEESTFSGSFSEKRFNLDIDLSGNCKLLRTGSMTVLKEKEIAIHSKLDVDQGKNTFQLLTGEFGINQLMLTLKGSIQNSKKSSDYQLSFKANKISIQDLLSTLPVQLPESFKTYQSSGTVFFEGSINGVQSKSSKPQIKIQFGIENGVLTEPESKIKLEQIFLKGSFANGSNGNMREAEIRIPEFKASMVGSKLNGQLQVTNMESPVLTLDLNGDADLHTLQTFFKWEDVKEIEGSAQFTLSLKGEKLSENWDWSNPQNRGIFALKVEKLKLNYLDKSLNHLELHAELNHNLLWIKQADLKIDNSDFKIAGNIPGFMDFIFQKEVLLKADLQVQSQNMNVADVLIYNSSDPREEGEKPLNYILNLKLNAGNFIYDDFRATQLKTDAVLYPDKIEFMNTLMNTCGGTFSGKGEWLMNKNQYVLKTTNEVKNIQMNLLFKQFNNFGQSEFTSKNLNGVLNAGTELIAVWDEKMNFLPEKLILLSDMTIKNGELLQYEPLSSLSKFVDVNELKNLKFSELKNTLTIKDKVLNIPAMDIRNNALNLRLTGTHTFSNQLDYKVKLSLSELISKRRKPQSNEFGEEDVKTRGINLYLTIQGPLDKLKFVFDSKGAKAQLKEDARQEKEVIKEILKQEFNMKKDSSLKKLEKKNDNNDELEFEDN